MIEGKESKMFLCTTSTPVLHTIKGVQWLDTHEVSSADDWDCTRRTAAWKKDL